MANQYDVLGKAPGLEELNKLSPNNVHLTIRGLNAGYGKMEILHNFNLTVGKAPPEEKVPVYNTGSESTDCIFCPFISLSVAILT